MNTSWPLTFSPMKGEISPSLNRWQFTLPKRSPYASAIFSARYVVALPENIFTAMGRKKHPVKERDLKVVVLLGFEPRKAESKSAVLPLHHRTINGKSRNVSLREALLVVRTGIEPVLPE